MPQRDALLLEQYQLTMGHVVTHPELEHAVRDAAAAAAAKDQPPEYIDLMPWLERRGFVLPAGSTAKLRLPSAVEANEDDDTQIIICVSYHGHSFCAEWRPPIVIETPSN